MRNVCLLVITIIIGLSNVQAQKFTGLGDTIVVYIDNQIEIKISIADYSTFSENSESYKNLLSFQSLVPEVRSRLEPDLPDRVIYDIGDKLIVEKNDLNYHFLIDDGEVNDTGIRDLAILRSENSYVIITTTDLNNITDVQLENCLKGVISKLPQKKNNSFKAVYECNNGSVNLISNKVSQGASLDMLSLTGGAGAGLIKNKWVADLSAEIGISFNKKGVLRYYPYISTNLISDFTSETERNTYGFLNLGYRWNTDKKSEKPDWLGVEVGFMYKKGGDLFEKNAYKLGLNWSLFKGRSVYVSPQLYFTNDFNTIFPSVRIGIGL